MISATFTAGNFHGQFIFESLLAHRIPTRRISNGLDCSIMKYVSHLGFFLQLHERLVFRLATAQSSIALISNRINCNQHRRQHREPASEKCAYFSRFKPSPVVHIAISELQRSKSTCFFFFGCFYISFFFLSSTRTHSHTRIPHSNKFSALVVTKTLLEWGSEQQRTARQQQKAKVVFIRPDV